MGKSCWRATDIFKDFLGMKGSKRGMQKQSLELLAQVQKEERDEEIRLDKFIEKGFS